MSRAGPQCRAQQRGHSGKDGHERKGQSWAAGTGYSRGGAPFQALYARMATVLTSNPATSSAPLLAQVSGPLRSAQTPARCGNFMCGALRAFSAIARE
jgi:hypothetical protein